jgi:hypothetical protein
MRATRGVSAAYRPTLIGISGRAYAINTALLFAIGK